MSITALEIQEVRFGEVKKGYDPNEVDEFLERVAADVDTLNRALSEAASRIKAAEARAEEAEKQAAELAAAPPVAAEVPQAPVVEKDSSVSEDIISKAFIAAQKSADAMQDEARKEAEKVFREAEAKGRDIVREALAEKQKTLSELDRLRESSEQFRTEYLSLLKHFQADAQKRLSAFDDVVPAKTDPGKLSKEKEKLLAANDATVAGAKKAPESVTASSIPAPVAVSAPLETKTATALTTLDEDDDLDIEEID